MSTNFAIHLERPGDEAAIAQVTELAFRTAPHSSHTEQFIIAALRAAGELSISLVAASPHGIVGHVAFSPVTISDGSTRWFGLGPVAVLPPRQGQGIGRALIERGLAMLREQDAQGCVVLGEPAYYQRFGFRHASGCILAGIPPEYFLVLPFGNHVPQGEVQYSSAFAAQA